MSSLTDIFDAQALETLRKERRIDPHCVRQLRNNVFKKFRSDEYSRSEFPAGESVELHVLELFKSVDSSIDGATKLLFKTEAGMLIESVILRIATGRTTLCVSSQVGCAANCSFCATGKMGIARNLEPSEILDQIVQAGQQLSREERRLGNIVFMGMGEPFHNEENLYTVLDALSATHLFDRSLSNILVSTVGIPESMVRCVERFPTLNLALSLHSANQAVRETIIPLAKIHHLDQLHDALTTVNRLSGRPVMIEYLMLAGVNDSMEAAQELIAWLRGLNVHLNLIPYNAIDDAPELTATATEDITAFADVIKASGQKTTVRYSLGNDIAAACGQLVRKENRAKAMDA